MKFLKGCLITVIILIVLCTTGWLFLENNVGKNLENLSQKVSKNWDDYIINLKIRNIEFIHQKTENDSIKFYSEKSNWLINSKDYLEELQLNEYKLNKVAMSHGLKSNLNDSLNLNLDNYNKAVREYNVYRTIFPNSLIARKMTFKKSYKYFVIRYGVDNEKAWRRKKEMENWVKNGGPIPE